nr:hypothetical protein L203_01811 [Cryptococcus depauperatus CBS 7841]
MLDHSAADPFAISKSDYAARPAVGHKGSYEETVIPELGMGWHGKVSRTNGMSRVDGCWVQGMKGAGSGLEVAAKRCGTMAGKGQPSIGCCVCGGRGIVGSTRIWVKEAAVEEM